MIEAYSSAFVIYVLYGFIEVWFERGMRDTTEELCTLLPGTPKHTLTF